MVLNIILREMSFQCQQTVWYSTQIICTRVVSLCTRWCSLLAYTCTVYINCFEPRYHVCTECCMLY